MVPKSTHSRTQSEVEKLGPSKPNAIRYSSPKPWILAIMLSLVLWAMLGWLYICLR
jgi:hypothetical protein